MGFIFNRTKKGKPPCEHQLALIQQSGQEIADGERNAEDEPTCSACKQERQRARKYRWKVILSLTFLSALQALDTTLVASALPWIALAFGEIAQLNWIVSAFTLTSAAFIPFWGQMVDIFGRHATLQSCTFIALIGSTLCTSAPVNDFPVLLLGRALLGMGCAGLGITIRTVLADKVSLKENSKNTSLFSLVSGISYSIGPWLGGVLTDANWRWCFGINIPICVLSMVTLFFFLRRDLLGPQPIPELDENTETGRRSTFARRLKTVDVAGQGLCLLGLTLLVLAFTWAGGEYRWNSPAVLVPLILGTIAVACFIVWEFYCSEDRMLAKRFPLQRPMLPWHLLSNKNISLLFYINFATGMGLYSVFYFVSMYFTLGELTQPSQAGVQLLLYVPGIGFGAVLSFLFCNVWPRKTWYPLFLGSLLEAIGLALLTLALHTRNLHFIFGTMVIAGAGSGLRMMPGTLHGLGFFPRSVSTVVSLMAVALPLGGALGLTIMTTVFNNKTGIGENSPLRNFATVKNLPGGEQDRVTETVREGVVWAYISILPFMFICVVASLLLGNVTITNNLREHREEAVPSGNVVSESYPLYLLRKWPKNRGGDGSVEEGIPCLTGSSY